MKKILIFLFIISFSSFAFEKYSEDKRNWFEIIPTDIWGVVFDWKEDNIYYRKIIKFLLISKAFTEIFYLSLSNLHINELTYPENIIKFKNLKILNSSFNQKLLGDLSYISRLVKLESINFSYCIKTNDEILSNLCKLTKLRNINLCYCVNISENGLKNLSDLTNIKRLNLSSCENAIKGLCHLTSLKNIQFINLENSRIRDDNAKYLSHFINLIEVKLGETKITDETLRHLSSLTNIKKLDLNFCSQITDKGLKYLSKMTDLEFVFLRGCKKIKGLNSLGSRPNCLIIWDLHEVA